VSATFDYGISTEAMKAAFEIKSRKSSYSCVYYELVRKDPHVPWPSDAACLKFCDDRNLSGSPSHFGGRVRSMASGDAKEVCVYVD
jgi:hypothetical protein